jgi:hypothetical protein
VDRPTLLFGRSHGPSRRLSGIVAGWTPRRCTSTRPKKRAPDAFKEARGPNTDMWSAANLWALLSAGHSIRANDDPLQLPLLGRVVQFQDGGLRSA